MTVDDATFAVSALVEFTHAVLAQERKIVQDLLQVLAAPNLFLLAEIRTTRHITILTDSPFIRLYRLPSFPMLDFLVSQEWSFLRMQGSISRGGPYSRTVAHAQ